MEHHDTENISPVVIQLMWGILYKEDRPGVWELMEKYEGSVRDYLSVLDLELEIYDSDGFAYLKSKDAEGRESSSPRLIQRRPLSYPVSLILALLRRKLTEHDAYSSESRLILEAAEVRDMVSAFFPASNNEVKYLKRLDAHLQKIHDLGFIRFLDKNKEKFEVKRILKAYIDAQWLSDLDARMEEYRDHGSTAGAGVNDHE